MIDENLLPQITSRYFDFNQLSDFATEYKITLDGIVCAIRKYTFKDRVVSYYYKNDKHKEVYSATDAEKILNSDNVVIVEDSDSINNKWVVIINDSSVQGFFVSQTGELHRSLAVTKKRFNNNLVEKDLLFDNAEDAIKTLMNVEKLKR